MISVNLNNNHVLNPKTLLKVKHLVSDERLDDAVKSGLQFPEVVPSFIMEGVFQHFFQSKKYANDHCLKVV